MVLWFAVLSNLGTGFNVSSLLTMTAYDSFLRPRFASSVENGVLLLAYEFTLRP